MHSKEYLLEVYAAKYAELQIHAYMVVENHTLAEDIVQDLGIKIVSNPAQFAEAENLPAYYMTCITNAAINLIKREKRNISFEYESLTYHKRKEAFECKIDRDLSMDLERILNAYSAEEIRLIELRYLYGYGVTEIANMLGIKPNAVSQQIFRVKAKLKTDLKREKILFVTLLFYLAQRTQESGLLP